jgi:hypothetical protein
VSQQIDKISEPTATVGVFCRDCRKGGRWELTESQADAIADELFNMHRPEADLPGPCGHDPVYVVSVTYGRGMSFDVEHATEVPRVDGMDAVFPDQPAATVEVVRG